MKIEVDSDDMAIIVFLLFSISIFVMATKGCEIERRHTQWMTEHSITNQVNK